MTTDELWAEICQTEDDYARSLLIDCLTRIWFYEALLELGCKNDR